MFSDVTVRAAGAKGRGVFATRDFRPREVVYRMGGKRVGLVRCAVEIAIGRARLDDPLQITNREYILLDATSICFNHSCDATCAIVGESDLVAIDAIAAGTELTFDYSLTVRPSFYSWAWAMPCACGAPHCRGRVGDITSVPSDRLGMVARSKLLQDYILDDVRLRKLLAAVLA